MTTRKELMGGKGYIVDFVCLERKGVIELDDGQHADQKAYDAHRRYPLTRRYAVTSPTRGEVKKLYFLINLHEGAVPWSVPSLDKLILIAHK
jgi:hypothetical protein